MSNAPEDPRDKRIAALEREITNLRFQYELQFGNEKVSGAVVTLLTTMASDLKEVKAAIFGDPADGSVGLFLRLDRMEQWQKTARWTISALFTACAGQIVWWLTHR